VVCVGGGGHKGEKEWCVRHRACQVSGLLLGGEAACVWEVGVRGEGGVCEQQVQGLDGEG
jgi:hypothetical protein